MQLLLLSLALVGLSAAALESSVRPGINAPFENPEVTHWIEAFEREGREIRDKRQEIVAALDLRPGMAVADIGAGTGFFVRLLAREMGADGRVYAVDIARNFVEAIERRARQDGQDWIRGIVNPPDSSGLGEASVDLIFTSDTYHHFEYPQSMLASIHRALRPGGSLVIIDFERIPGVSSAWVSSHVRAGKETVIGEVEAAGFRLEREIPPAAAELHAAFAQALNRAAGRRVPVPSDRHPPIGGCRGAPYPDITIQKSLAFLPWAK